MTAVVLETLLLNLNTFSVFIIVVSLLINFQQIIECHEFEIGSQGKACSNSGYEQ